MKRTHAFALGIWIAFCVLYGATAAPSVVALFDDSLELQLVAPTFGIAHPTGYPLYVLLGGLWSRALFPFGNWAWRMNLFSAVAAATAVLLVFLLARQLAPRPDGRPDDRAGLAAAVAFGLAPIWWQQATVAEVYALHGLFVAAILLAAVAVGRTCAAASGGVETGSCGRRVAGLCLLLGLSLAHHRTTLLLLPGLAVYLSRSVPGIWRPRRIWLLWATALVAPLMLHAYLPIRAAMGVRDLHGSYVASWPGFWDHVLARGYAGFFADNPLAVVRSPAAWATLFSSALGWLGLGLAVLGLGWLVDRRGRPAKEWCLVLLVLGANLIFAFNYRVADVEVFLLPAVLCTTVFIGGGVGMVARLLDARPPLAAVAQWGLIVLLAVAPLGRGDAVNRRQDWAVHDYAVALASVPFAPGSQVIGLEGEMTALKYMQQAEGRGQNAEPVVADDPGVRQQRLADAVQAGRPAYLTRELAGIEGQYSFSGEGPLVRVWPRGKAEVEEPPHRLQVAMAGGALLLEGYDLAVLDQEGGPALRATFFWRPQEPLTQTLKLSLRVLDRAGQPLTWPDGEAVVADRFPLRQVAPSPAWLPGERVRDVHDVPLPRAAASIPLRLQVIVYNADTLAEVGRWEGEVP